METKSESRITEESVLKAIEQGCQSPTAVAKKLGYKSGSSGIIKAILKVVPDLRERLQALNDADKAGKADEVDEADEVEKTDDVGEVDEADKADEADKPDAPVIVKPASPSAYPIPDCVPYRKSSGYAQAWAILYAYRNEGITKKEFVAKYQAATGKPEKNCGYDCHVVASSHEDGSSHKSAEKAAKSYWVERADGLLKLHLIAGAQKTDEEG